MPWQRKDVFPVVEKYGGCWDCLLCFGLAVLLGTRLPMRNPEGHSPRWWKRHPQAKAKAEAAILPASQSVATPEPKKFRWDITLTLLVAVMGMLFYLFPPQSALSTSLWLFILFGLSIYPALHFADIAFSGKKKVAYPIMLALFITTKSRLDDSSR